MIHTMHIMKKEGRQLKIWISYEKKKKSLKFSGNREGLITNIKFCSLLFQGLEDTAPTRAYF